MNEIEKYNKWSKSIKGMRFQSCCQDHCRDWRETIGGLPASNHSPTCPNYKLETFFKVSGKGKKAPYCVIEDRKEIKDFCETETREHEKYDIIEIQMTRDQFERLGEFDGF